MTKTVETVIGYNNNNEKRLYFPSEFRAIKPFLTINLLFVTHTHTKGENHPGGTRTRDLRISCRGCYHTATEGGRHNYESVVLQSVPKEQKVDHICSHH
jgi:hypothetical protein